MSPSTTLLVLAPLFMRQPSTRQDQLDLSAIASAVEAYQQSIVKLEIRTASRFFSDSAQGIDPTLWGPDVVMYQEYGMDSSEKEYCRTLVDRRNGITTIDEDDRRKGAKAYSVLRSNLDPNIVQEVHISRNFRDKASGMGRPLEILMGLVALDGEPLHRLLKASDCRLIGRKKVDGETCFVVESLVFEKRVLYYLSPSHDLLARRVEHLDSDGKTDQVWMVEAFRQVNSRWFPERVVRTFSVMTQGRAIRRRCETELEYVRVNEPIAPEKFEVSIPEGAKVIDDTRDTPVEYIEGGTEAYKRLLRRLEELEEARKEKSAPLDAQGKPVVVEHPFQWALAAAAALGAVSGLLLVVATWLRVRGN